MRGPWRWLPTVLLLPAAAILLWIGYTGDVSSLLLGLFALVLAWWFAPRHGSDATHATVTAEPLEHPVVIYWRPGCLYCARLRAALGRRGRAAAWVNIWADNEGAAFVRSVNDGDETVPTVLIAGVAHTNPEPRVVRAALG